MEIALALAAAACWGVSDFAAGLVSRRLSTVLVTMIVLGAGGFATIAIAATIEEPPDGRTVVFAVLAGATTAIGVTAFFHALSVGVIGTIAPISSAGAAIPVVVGLLRGERPSIGQLTGVAVIVGGVAMIVRATAHETTPQATNPRLALLLAILAAVTLGSYYIFAKEGSAGHPLWYASVGQLAAATPLALIVLARRSWSASAADVRSTVAIGVVNAGGWVLSALALREGFLALVSVLTALYPVVTVMLARFVVSERLTRWQLAGAGVTFGGVGLIAGA